MKTTIHKVLVTLALGIFSSTSQAQDLLITNAQLLTQSGSDTAKIDILIEDGVIAEMGVGLEASSNTPVLDADGKPVTPAFFAGLTVSGLSDVELVSESVDSGYSDLFTETMHPEFDVRVAYNPHSSIVPITRVEGFGYALLAATSRDHTLSGTGGLVRFDGGFDSFEGRDVLFISAGGWSGDRVGGSRAVHWMLLEQAVAETKGGDLEIISRQGRETLKRVMKDGVVLFHAERAADIMQALRFIADNRLRGVIAGASEGWMVADALASASVPVIINALDNLPASFDSLGARLDNAALLHSAGVEVMFTSNETHNARKIRQVAGNAVANGLPHEVAIAAMTTTPARVFGGQDRSLRVGNRADLVIWGGDPLEVNAVAKQVVINGKLDSMRSRQTLLRDRYLPESPAIPRAYIKP